MSEQLPLDFGVAVEEEVSSSGWSLPGEVLAMIGRNKGLDSAPYLERPGDHLEIQGFGVQALRTFSKLIPYLEGRSLLPEGLKFKFGVYGDFDEILIKPSELSKFAREACEALEDDEKLKLFKLRQHILILPSKVHRSHAHLRATVGDEEFSISIAANNQYQDSAMSSHDGPLLFYIDNKNITLDRFTSGRGIQIKIGPECFQPYDNTIQRDNPLVRTPLRRERQEKFTPIH